LMGRATFLWLFEHSVAFNRFLVRQLNERLGQFIAVVEYDRTLNVAERVARNIAWLFNPVLFPGGKGHLEITQEELGCSSAFRARRPIRLCRRWRARALCGWSAMGSPSSTFRVLPATATERTTGQSDERNNFTIRLPQKALSPCCRSVYYVCAPIAVACQRFICHLSACEAWISLQVIGQAPAKERKTTCRDLTWEGWERARRSDELFGHISEAAAVERGPT